MWSEELFHNSSLTVNAVHSLGGVMKVRQQDVCGFSNLVGNEVVSLTGGEVQAVEDALEVWRARAVPGEENLAWRRWRVASAVVRVDMAPIRTLPADTPHSVYEVEGGPGGLGILTSLGGGSMVRRIGTILRRLGIEDIGWEVAPSRLTFERELMEGVAQLDAAGIRTSRGLDHNLPLILRSSGEDEIPFERCLCDYSQGGGDKFALESFGVVAAESVEYPFAAFPAGFVIKPRRGTGTKDIYAWTRRKPFYDFSASVTKVTAIHAEACAFPGEWVIQPFIPPEWIAKENFSAAEWPSCDVHLPKGMCRIWRLFATWNGERYEVVGGLWNARRSLRVHGASNTVWGLVTIP